MFRCAMDVHIDNPTHAVAHQAASRNLADALEIHQSVTGEASGNMQRVLVL